MLSYIIEAKEPYFFGLFCLKGLNVFSNDCSFTNTLNNKQKSQHHIHFLIISTTICLNEIESLQPVLSTC